VLGQQFKLSLAEMLDPELFPLSDQSFNQVLFDSLQTGFQVLLGGLLLS